PQIDLRAISEVGKHAMNLGREVRFVTPPGMFLFSPTEKYASLSAMSEENVPKLRLKPRLAGAAPAEPAPAPETTPSPDSGDTESSLRLKPPVAENPPTDPVEPTPGPPPSEVVAPAFPPPVEPAATEAPLPAVPPSPKIVLRPKMPAPEGAAPSEEPVAPAVERPVSPAPLPAALPVMLYEKPPEAEKPTAPLFPPPPGLQKGEEAPAQLAEDVKAAMGGNPWKKRIFAIFGATAVMIMVSVGALYYLEKDVPVPPPVVRPKVESQAAGPDAPKGPLGAAKAAIAKKEGNLTDPANEVLNATVGPPLIPPAPLVPAAPAAVSVTPAGPSTEFVAWVRQLHVAGVRSGAMPRVFIDRTAYSPGDLVNPQLGITFVGYDADRRMLSFKDEAGFTVERRY
ncbi:MAG: hypothetical protein Q8J74_01710, partial [Candidatus Didemnitutus sp.]|nr:hypothetical protein [Candidatus Didemnitutus sp.]